MEPGMKVPTGSRSEHFAAGQREAAHTSEAGNVKAVAASNVAVGVLVLVVAVEAEVAGVAKVDEVAARMAVVNIGG